MENIILDENQIYKQVKTSKSDFLKFEDGNNKLIIKSHSGILTSHYVKNLGSVACMGKSCAVCKKGNRKRREIFYWAKLNEKEGIIRLPITVFLQILDLVREGGFEKVESPRQAQWLVIKSGKGTNTRYTVSFAGAIEENGEEIKKNTEKLKKFLQGYSKKLEDRYTDFTLTDEIPEDKREDINPDDIPF